MRDETGKERKMRLGCSGRPILIIAITLTWGLSPGMEGTMTNGCDPLALPWLRIRMFRSTACEPGETGASLRFDPAGCCALPNVSPCDFFMTFELTNLIAETKSSDSEHLCR